MPFIQTIKSALFTPRCNDGTTPAGSGGCEALSHRASHARPERDRRGGNQRMPLPGKLCVGILEEDNPQKSYFRFKPLIVESGDHFDPFTAAKAYPEDGCIRIVPDKNESSHFKARMRRLGLYAFVDLRDHPGSHDKIRINKNYSGDGQERNAHILYSDVVREPGRERAVRAAAAGARTGGRRAAVGSGPVPAARCSRRRARRCPRSGPSSRCPSRRAFAWCARAAASRSTTCRCLCFRASRTAR